MTELAETASRIMNVAKTNEGFRNLLGMVTPSKGETPKSYLDRITATYNNQKNRYLQAEFETGVGVPVDQDGTKSRDNYVSKLAGDVDYNTGNDGSASKDSDTHYTKEFKDEAKSHGVTPEQLHAFLAAKGVVSYG